MFWMWTILAALNVLTFWSSISELPNFNRQIQEAEDLVAMDRSFYGLPHRVLTITLMRRRRERAWAYFWIVLSTFAFTFCLWKAALA